VIPPPAPPIQPAPPGGARREAKQRQAAAAKSEEGGQEGASEARHQGGDLATDGGVDRGSHAMTRHGVDPRHPFTAVVNAEQVSGWTRGALYGGTITLIALMMALGWESARPKSRGRPRSELRTAAPAWVRIRNRR
jgi:hypothetical protein